MNALWAPLRAFPNEALDAAARLRFLAEKAWARALLRPPVKDRAVFPFRPLARYRFRERTNPRFAAFLETARFFEEVRERLADFLPVEAEPPKLGFGPA